MVVLLLLLLLLSFLQYDVWFQKLRITFPGSSHRDFFASFPFQDGAVKERIRDAFLVHENQV